MKLAYPLTLAVALTVFPGCGPSISGICADKCDCTGACSPDDEDDCVDNLEDIERAALDAGCEEQFDEALSCIDDELECRGDRIDVDGCSRQVDRLSRCAGVDVGLLFWVTVSS